MFLWWINISIIQVSTHFLEFLKICPKMFPIFAKTIDLCLLTQKNQTLQGVIGRDIALWQNLWVGVGQFERRSSSARVACALRPVKSIPVAIFLNHDAQSAAQTTRFRLRSELPYRAHRAIQFGAATEIPELQRLNLMKHKTIILWSAIETKWILRLECVRKKLLFIFRVEATFNISAVLENHR